MRAGLLVRYRAGLLSLVLLAQLFYTAPAFCQRSRVDVSLANWPKGTAWEVDAAYVSAVPLDPDTRDQLGQAQEVYIDTVGDPYVYTIYWVRQKLTGRGVVMTDDRGNPQIKVTSATIDTMVLAWLPTLIDGKISVPPLMTRGEYKRTYGDTELSHSKTIARFAGPAAEYKKLNEAQISLSKELAENDSLLKIETERRERRKLIRKRPDLFTHLEDNCHQRRDLARQLYMASPAPCLSALAQVRAEMARREEELRNNPKAYGDYLDGFFDPYWVSMLDPLGVQEKAPELAIMLAKGQATGDISGEDYLEYSRYFSFRNRLYLGIVFWGAIDAVQVGRISITSADSLRKKAIYPHHTARTQKIRLDTTFISSLKSVPGYADSAAFILDACRQIARKNPQNKPLLRFYGALIEELRNESTVSQELLADYRDDYNQLRGQREKRRRGKER